MRSHYVSALIAEGLTQGGMLATFFYIGALISPIAVLEYALVRRIFSFIFPICMLGFDTGLARFGWTYQKKIHSLIYTALLLSLSMVVLFSLFALLFQRQFINLAFGSSDYAHYLIPLCALLAGGIFHASAYNAYRGMLKTHTANILLVLNHGLTPLILVFGSDSVDDLLIRTGIIWILFSSCALMPLLWKLRTESFDRAASRTTLFFGLKRFPADLLQIAFFSLPVIFAAHIWGASAAGQLALGISLIGMAGSAFSPFKVVFLPHISKLVSEYSLSAVVKKAGIYSIYLLAALSLLLIIGEIFLARIVPLIFHSNDPEFIMLLRVLLLGIIPYCIYSSSKSLIDIHRDGSYNSRNMGIAFVVFIVLLGIGGIVHLPFVSSAAWIVVSLAVLSLLTLYDIKKFIASHNSV